MVRLFRSGLLAVIAGVMLWCAGPAPAVADDDDDHDGYWRGYWNWYDRSYRPYYHRHHRRHDDYGYDYPGRRYRYGHGPGVYRYQYPDYYRYHRDYYPRSGVRIGPFRLEYWH